MIKAGISRSGSFVEGDAPVGTVPNTTTSQQLEHVNNRPVKRRQPSAPPPPPVHPDNKRAKRATGRNLNGQGHSVFNGYYTHNRSGKPICDEWQVGTCTRPNCPKAHVCNLCLDNRHGSRSPQQCTAPPPAEHRGGKGGKGKGGKGKGKKGY